MYKGKYENTCCTYLTKDDIPCTKCSVSNVWLEKAIDNLDSEADNSLSKEQEKTDEVPLVSTNCDRHIERINII